MQTKLTDKLIAVLIPKEHYKLWLNQFVNASVGYYDNKSYQNKIIFQQAFQFKIIGTVTKSTKSNCPIFDFDCEKYVERLDNENSYKDYELELTRDCEYILKTKEESFITLLNSKGVFLEQLNNQKILILERL